MLVPLTAPHTRTALSQLADARLEPSGLHTTDFTPPVGRVSVSAAHAAFECVAVVDAAWTLVGGSAVYDTSVLGRCLRDAHVVTQHIMVAPKLHETLGKFLLGNEFDASMI